MKIDRDLARQQVDVYSELLLQHAVIGDIESCDKRGIKTYSFDIISPQRTYSVECVDIKELALLLSSMWSAYEKAWSLFVS